MSGRRQTILLVSVAICMTAILVVAAPTSRTGERGTWPFSAAYRGLRPLSEGEAKEEAIRLCRRDVKTTDNVAVGIGPWDGQPDYFRVVVRGKRGDSGVTHVVFIHRFNGKGSFVQSDEPAREPRPPEGAPPAATAPPPQ